MPALVRLLSSSARPSVQRVALALCQQLCGSRRACDTILEANNGAAAPLASMLSTSAASDVEVAVACLECIEALSRSGVTQAQMAVRNSGAVPHLIQMMSHSNARVAQVAASLVSELCPGDVHNAEQLYESGGLVMFSEQLNSGDARSQLQALSALSQLSANQKQAGAIVENALVPALLELLDHPSQELKSYAAITFGNLGSSGAIPQRQLESPAHRTWSTSYRLPTVWQRDPPLERSPPCPHGQSSAVPSSRWAVYLDLSPFLSGDPDTSYHAVQAIAQFAADEAFRTSLAETRAGGSTPLLSSHLPHVQQCALSAIANVSFISGAVGQLASSGALAHLGQMLFNAADPESGRTVLTAICNILKDAPYASDALLQVGGRRRCSRSWGRQARRYRRRRRRASATCAGTAPLYLRCSTRIRSRCSASYYTRRILARSSKPSMRSASAAEDEAAASAVALAGAVSPLTTLLLSSSSSQSTSSST